ncbi:MAG: NAD(+)/NADH kinase [Prevotella sp.]|nr:NAD(+)/NADH kinase [Prevotella sp.]MCM1074491.1 NAD(+)/NADH kinase [Ruminococcus sp.]
MVSLYGNTWQVPALNTLANLISLLAEADISVEIEAEFYDWLKAHGVDLRGCVSTQTPAQDSRMIISAGGDGTLLKAARWGALAQIPIAGVNTGHLGFLTAWHGSDITELVHSLVRDDFEVECRTMLQVKSDAIPKDVWPYALNDISLLKDSTGSMISVRTLVDGEYLTDYVADGLVIATPSGSTAYNLSAGGPILQPTVPGLVLNPVAPHTLTMRPLVVSDECCISTCTEGRAESFLLSIDGASVSLPVGTQVDIFKAPFPLYLVCRNQGGFAGALRDKLLWGSKPI